MKQKHKDWIKAWLLYDLIAAIALWNILGPEELAKMACQVIDDPVCEELE